MLLLRPLPVLRALLTLLLALLPFGVPGQVIQRCEAADGSISYSNAACPPATRTVKALAPAIQPTEEAHKEARERLQRDKDVSRLLEAHRQPGQAQARTGQAYVSVEEARRAADCAYLRAELDSNRRLRSVLTTRRYYATEDVEQMDAREAQLAADYRRFCSR